MVRMNTFAVKPGQKNHLGDNMTLDLFGEQNELAEAITALGKPVLKKNIIKKGETKKVIFDITPEKLAFHNIDMKFLVEPGVFEIMTGHSSNDADLQKTELTVK
jgi:hypothetical protein